MTITAEEAEALARQLEGRLISGSIFDQLEAAAVIRALAAERDLGNKQIHGLAEERERWKERAKCAEAEAERLRAGLASKDVEWVVNDLAELGVKIGNQFFFCYKGSSLVYGELDPDPTKPPVHEEGDPSVGYREGDRMRWRYVGKREFGECIHPINYADPTKIGRVSLADGNDWNELPAARAALGEAIMPISRPDDPIEGIVFDALTRAGIPFVMGRQAQGLDFLMTESDVYIECKQFHTPRAAEQMARVKNVIVIQGRGAATAFAEMITNEKARDREGEE